MPCWTPQPAYRRPPSHCEHPTWTLWEAQGSYQTGQLLRQDGAACIPAWVRLLCEFGRQTAGAECPLRLASPAPHHLIRAYHTSRGAQAIAITWDESYSDPDWSSDYTDGQAAVTQPRREFAVRERAPKPLKINRDLLLVSKQ